MSKITDARSFKMEPNRKNLWVLKFTSIPGNTSSSDAEEELCFATKTCKAPDLTFQDVAVKRLHEKFKFAGSPTWGDIPATFYDFIRNGSGKSSIDIIYNWNQMIYNAITGQMGYATQYKTSCTLAQIDPAGNVVRAWNLFGIFPKQTQYGEGLSYEEEGTITELSCTFSVDLCIKVQDSTSSTESA